MRWESMACCPRLRVGFLDLADDFFDFDAERWLDEFFFDMGFFEDVADKAGTDNNNAPANAENIIFFLNSSINDPHL